MHQAGLLNVLNGAITGPSEVWLFNRVPLEAREWMFEKVGGAVKVIDNYS